MREKDNPRPDGDDLWYDAWIMPIVQGLYQLDGEAARLALAAAHAAPRGPELSADFSRVADYRLGYLAYQVELGFPSAPGMLRQAYDAALLALQLPATGEISARHQARLRLQLGCLADADGVAQLDAAEFDRLLADVVARGENSEVWYFATGWAFARGRDDVVTAALEYLTVNSTRFFADFLWQRVNLMHKLLAGEASGVDVLELIKRIEFIRQFEAVEREVWPACQRAGLVDGALKEAFEQQRAELRKSAGDLPQPQPPTKRIRKDL